MRTKIFLRIVVAFIAGSSIIAGCEKKEAAPMPTPPNQVWMYNYIFDPNVINVPVNTTITWTNKDNFAHTVTSDSNFFNSGQIAGGGSYSFQFTKAGTYSYKCLIHTYMTGTVVVH